jgi:hypothetical protein
MGVELLKRLAAGGLATAEDLLIIDIAAVAADPNVADRSDIAALQYAGSLPCPGLGDEYQCERWWNNYIEQYVTLRQRVFEANGIWWDFQQACSDYVVGRTDARVGDSIGMREACGDAAGIATLLSSSVYSQDDWGTGVGSLVHLGAKRELAGLLTQTDKSALQQLAIYGLKQLGATEYAADIVATAIRSDMNEYHIEQVVDALDALGDKSQAEYLMSLLRQPHYSEPLKLRILEVLGGMDAVSYAAEIETMSIAQKEQHAMFAKAGFAALAAIRPDRLVEIIQSDDCKFDASLKMWAFEALVSKEAKEQLARLARNPIAPDFQSMAIDALGKMRAVEYSGDIANIKPQKGRYEQAVSLAMVGFFNAVADKERLMQVAERRLLFTGEFTVQRAMQFLGDLNAVEMAPRIAAVAIAEGSYGLFALAAIDALKKMRMAEQLLNVFLRQNAYGSPDFMNRLQATADALIELGAKQELAVVRANPRFELLSDKSKLAISEMLEQ